MNVQQGQVLQAVSGTRPISVTVCQVFEDGRITLRCNRDWSYQAGTEFTLEADQFADSAWGKAAAKDRGRTQNKLILANIKRDQKRFTGEGPTNFGALA